MPGAVFVLLHALAAFLNILRYLILARCVLSFLPLRENPVISLIVAVTEPIVAPFRVLLSRIPGYYSYDIDFAPLLALLTIGFALNLLP